MWTTSQPREVEIEPRPVRIAYLVPHHLTHELLSAVFDESMSRWGGRRTPIIQTDGCSVDSINLALLDLWDADVIYSYVRLSPEFRHRIQYLFAPSEVLVHEALDAAGAVTDPRPDLSIPVLLLSSLSSLPRFAARFATEGSGLPRLLDKERGVNVDRDLEDSFGFLSNSHPDVSLLPFGHRLSFKPPEASDRARRFKEPEEIAYLTDRGRLPDEIASRNALLTGAQMSDLFCPYQHHLVRGRNGWDDHLTIVVGDEVADRLLFWRAVHRYRSLRDVGNFQVIRVSPRKLEGDVPAWLVAFCGGQKNRRHLEGNQAPKAVVRSCSICSDDLKVLAEKLRTRTTMVTADYIQDSNLIFAPLQEHVRSYRRGSLQRSFPSIWASDYRSQGKKIRFAGDQFEVPHVEPTHLGDVATSVLTRGAWINDLSIQRSENHSWIGNREHEHRFPRRLRLDDTISVRSYGTPLQPPPSLRPTEKGLLSVWDARAWPRPIISISSDLPSFFGALANYEQISSDTSEHGYKASRCVAGVRISDKGRDLLGVLQFFGSLPEAMEFLTNPLILKVIETLSPAEPASNPNRIKTLAQDLKAAFQGRSVDELDVERLARRALSLAARSFQPEINEALYQDYRGLLRIFGRDVTGNQARADLKEAVTYLRNKGFFQQGFGWRCSMCQHHNWTNLERMTTVLACEICQTDESSPVEDSLHLRLNSFVVHAFASTSGQQAVIWALNQIYRKAVWSFAFVPSLEIEWRNEEGRSSEIDILAAVDGEVYLVEVKSSFSGDIKKEVEKFCEIVQELRPDRAVVAVGRPAIENPLDESFWAEIQQRLSRYDVRFELLTFNSTSSRRVPRRYERTMNWSVW